MAVVVDLIFFDAKVVRNTAGTSGALALGWIGVLAVEDYHEKNRNLRVIEKLFCNCHRLLKIPVENSLKSFKK